MRFADFQRQYNPIPKPAVFSVKVTSPKGTRRKRQTISGFHVGDRCTHNNMGLSGTVRGVRGDLVSVLWDVSARWTNRGRFYLFSDLTRAIEF